MKVFFRPFATTLLLILISGFCSAQEVITWRFTAEQLNQREAIIKLTAHLAPGWHLYSQHMKEGGPIPTTFTFNRTQDFELIGGTLEQGKAEKFNDEIYEMEIVWYSDSVSFHQRIALYRPEASITGTINYMVCNSQMCLPQEKEFEIHVQSFK